MRLEQVPDMADGGYWYVVPAGDDTSPITGSKLLWQHGDYHLIRTERPLNVELTAGPRASEIVAGAAADGRLPSAARRPFGRVWA